MRVVGEARHRRVVRHHRRRRARGPVRQLGEHRLRDDDGAGLAQVRRERGVVRRHEGRKGQGATRGADVRGVDVVLERDGDAVEGPAHAPGRTLTVQPVGFVQGAGVDRDDGVDAVLVGRDARQYCVTSCLDVIRPDSSAACRSGMPVSTTLNAASISRVGACAGVHPTAAIATTTARLSPRITCSLRQGLGRDILRGAGCLWQPICCDHLTSRRSAGSSAPVSRLTSAWRSS